MLLRTSLARRAPLLAKPLLANVSARTLCTEVGRSGKMAVNGVDLFYRTNGDAGLPLQPRKAPRRADDRLAHSGRVCALVVVPVF